MLISNDNPQERFLRKCREEPKRARSARGGSSINLTLNKGPPRLIIFGFARFKRSVKKHPFSLYWLCESLIISCIFRNFFSVTSSLVFLIFPELAVHKPYYFLYEIDGPDTCWGLFA